MPIEPIKEVVKVAVETSAHTVMDWIIAVVTSFVAALAAMWKYVSGKFSKIEVDSYDLSELKKDLEKHIAEESRVFETLFEKHDHALDQINLIGRSVARIEGKLSNGDNFFNHDRKEN